MFLVFISIVRPTVFTIISVARMITVIFITLSNYVLTSIISVGALVILLQICCFAILELWTTRYLPHAGNRLCTCQIENRLDNNKSHIFIPNLVFMTRIPGIQHSNVFCINLRQSPVRDHISLESWLSAINQICLINDLWHLLNVCWFLCWKISVHCSFHTKIWHNPLDNRFLL